MGDQRRKPIDVKLDMLIKRRVAEVGSPVPKIISLGTLREIATELGIKIGSGLRSPLSLSGSSS